jgi:hypothetical protein
MTHRSMSDSLALDLSVNLTSLVRLSLDEMEKTYRV